jgi:DNA-binding transcriptional LysR family regulator
MNVHHLELFFYVAKFEGITAAVRKMPYGIQQPAVSGQILQLEAELGVKLFNRRPFALTPEGDELYDYVYPFFSRMEQVEESLKGELGKHLRICASASVLRTHLPNVLERMKLRIPDLKLSLREVEPAAIYSSLLNQQSDIAISIIYGKLTDGLKAEELLRLPIVLLVPDTCKVQTLDDLIEESDDGTGMKAKIPLVGLPPHEALQQVFQQGLLERQIKWDVSVEVNSLDVIQSYVRRGFGAGIAVGVPGESGEKFKAEGCHVIPLDNFSPLIIGILYQGLIKPIAQEFIDETKKYTKKLV